MTPKIIINQPFKEFCCDLLIDELRQFKSLKYSHDKSNDIMIDLPYIVLAEKKFTDSEIQENYKKYFFEINELIKNESHLSKYLNKELKTLFKQIVMYQIENIVTEIDEIYFLSDDEYSFNLTQNNINLLIDKLTKKNKKGRYS